MTNDRNLHEPMTNNLNISKLVLNQFLCNDLSTVPKVQEVKYFLHEVLRTIGKVRSLNQIIEGFTLNLRNSDPDTLGRPRPGQIHIMT